MIYSNQRLFPFSCTAKSWGSDSTYEIFKVAMGTDRGNCLELISSPNGKGKISEGLNRMTTIGKTKKGLLRTTHGYDHNIYMLLATRTKKRESEAFRVISYSQTSFKVLKQATGIDSQNYLWHFVLLFAPNYSLIRVKEVNAEDKIYVVIPDDVEVYGVNDLEEVCKKYGLEMAKEEDWVSL